ncbi:MAG: DUF3021 domain-containing protein [Oscillospiraceae bacterium]|nr:DUF3021 domain-containing protein [Oscillospiraceae bacterium]
MKFITEFLEYFVIITTGVLIICAINISLSETHGESLEVGVTLWEIVGAGAATAFVTALVYRRECNTKKKFIAMVIIHYILICAIMIFMGVSFGWMDLNIGGIIMMTVSVALVYLFTYVISYISAKHQADEFNKALKEKYKDK